MKSLSVSKPYTKGEGAVKRRNFRCLSLKVGRGVLVIAVLAVSVLHRRPKGVALREIAWRARPANPSPLVPISPGGKVLMSMSIPALWEGCIICLNL